jgi:hypothetical protein
MKCPGIVPKLPQSEASTELPKLWLGPHATNSQNEAFNKEISNRYSRRRLGKGQRETKNTES